MQPRPHHSLQFNKDKIMQMTPLSDSPACFPFSRRTVAVIAVFEKMVLHVFNSFGFSQRVMTICEGETEKTNEMPRYWV